MSIISCSMCGGPAELGPHSTLTHVAPEMPRKLHVVIDYDGECVGVYLTRYLAEAAAARRVVQCDIEVRELDKLPDEPEPLAPTERELEEKQQRDRGYKDVGREYDKYEHEEFRP